MATILTKKSDTASAVPLAADLTNAAGGAELAVNATDKRLFSKTSGGTVVELGINPSSLTMPNGTANGVAYLNGSKVVTSGSALTFSGQQFAISSLGDQIKISNSVGNQLLTLSSNSAGSVFTSHDGTNFVPILWQSNTAELMRLTSTGLGIGTSSPTAFGSGYTTLTISGSNAGIFQSKNTSGDTRLYADTSGQALLGSWANTSLLLYTNSTLKATLDSSGNLGLGVTPSAWGQSGTIQALQIKNTAIAGSGAVAYWGSNWFGGGFDKYIANGAASLAVQISGAHQWYNAPSGTAGNAITFTQAMTLDASGNLGVGTTSPSNRLDVASSTNSTIGITRTGSHNVTLNAVAGGAFTIGLDGSGGGTERARIDSSGNMGVGTTSPSQRLDVTVSSSTEGSGLAVTNSLTGGYGSGLTFYSLRSDTSAKVVAGSIVINGASAWNSNATTSSSMIFSTVGANTLAERARIDSSGNLCIGTTTAGAKFTLEYVGTSAVGQNINDSANTTNSTLMQFLIQGTQAGTIKRVAATSAVVYNTTSDYRLKNVTGAVTGQGARIDALKPIDYLWKEGNTQARGFLAHEFQAVYPNSVSGDKDAVDANGNPEYQAMQAATSEVIADLVAEIQSLRQRIATLEAK